MEPTDNNNNYNNGDNTNNNGDNTNNNGNNGTTPNNNNRVHQFYTTRPARPVRTDKFLKKKHLSLDMEMKQKHSLVEVTTNNNNTTHRDALNIHFLTRTQQVIRQRIHGNRDPSTIDLSSCHLDNIPKFIFTEVSFQESLTELNLSNNKLTSLPTSIGILKHLVVLDCTFNRIIDLPVELADLGYLQHLNLAGNPLIPALKQPLLLGTATLLQHLRERKRNYASSEGSLRRRTLKELLKPSPTQPNSSPTQSRGAPGSPTSPLKSPLTKSESLNLQQNSPPPSPHSSAEDSYGNPLITQLKLGLEASVGLSTTSATANNKFKAPLSDERGQFEFNTYCNAEFISLRKMAGIDTEQFRKSLGSLSPLGFSGKSGSVLLKSADNLLVLKTISKEESAFLRRILSHYCEYMKRHPNTILTRFWGLYKLVRSAFGKVSFIVMKNAFSSGVKIHERYDLKGSRIGRHSGEENLRLSRVMLKDLDLCQLNRRIRLGSPCRQHFLDQITSDCKFLEKFEIIDYSLILGIHYNDIDTVENGLDDAQKEAQGVAPEKLYGEIVGKGDSNEPVGEVYFMTIIDFLQPYNLRKQMEYGIKSIKYGDDISVIPPLQYANRFITFITAVVD